MRNTDQLLTSVGLGLGLTLAVLAWLGVGLWPTAIPPMARAQSGLLYVTPGGTDADNNCSDPNTPCATLQRAVDVAAPGDEIRVTAGVYTGVNARSGLRQMVYLSKTVTIRGGYTHTNWNSADPMGNPTILDAQGQGRVLYISGSISPTIEGLYITGGDATGLGGTLYFSVDVGGGVYVITATATLSNNVISNNVASRETMGWGGGVYLGSNSATLQGNTVEANTAWDKGGGVYLVLSRAKLSGNTIRSNTTQHDGGAVYLFLSSAILEANVVISNTAEENGGGLYLDNSAATLSANIIIGNWAEADGGGACLLYSPATLSGNTIASNIAESGGGVLMEYSHATLFDNIIRDNTSTGHGGGVYLSVSDATLNDNTINSNRATYSGAGIFSWSSKATLRGNTVYNNVAQGLGGGIAFFNEPMTMHGNTIAANTADYWGGGVYLEFCDATMLNNVVIDNQTSSLGSGVFIWGSQPRLLHTTIARNHGGDGSGLYVTSGSDALLTNTILVSQTQSIIVRGSSRATIDGVLWYANTTNISGTGAITVTNAFTGAPAFASDGYHLTAGSAAINKGTDSGVTVDIDGEPRPVGAYDIGADEYVKSRVYLPAVFRER
jgi:parallel beta-helix repeat protein